jgi:hypothetical protein
VQPADGLGFGPLAAAVISAGRVGISMAHQLLDNHDIGAGIEQIAGEGAATVVRRTNSSSASCFP